MSIFPEAPFPTPPIWVDFNTRDRLGRIRLDLRATVANLNACGVTLREGMRLFVFDCDGDENFRIDDLVACGTATYDEVAERWALNDWYESTTHYSLLDETSRSSYRQYRPKMGEPLPRQ
jgi:hypothetical protein